MSTGEPHEKDPKAPRTSGAVSRRNMLLAGTSALASFPKLVDIKADPFERAMTDAGEYARWRVEHAFALVPAQTYVARHLQTYTEFPPRQKPGSFSLDQVLAGAPATADA